MFVFRNIWHVLYSCNTRFETRPFALLPTSYIFNSLIEQRCNLSKDSVNRSKVRIPTFHCLLVCLLVLLCFVAKPKLTDNNNIL